jgi:hypothetical protein
MTYIHLASGGKINLADPQPGDIRVYDIACSLAKLCRFNGHCRKFYSVAEHSIHCSTLVEKLGGTIEQQRHAVLHDAVEAYLGDVTSPLKSLVPQYEELEAKFQSLIYQVFGLNPANDDVVVAADQAMLAYEQRQLFNDCETYVVDEADVVYVRCWTPEHARKRFIDRIWRLSNNE